MEETSIKNNTNYVAENLPAKTKQTKIVLSNQSELSLAGISKVIASTETLIQVVMNGTTLEVTGEKLSTTKIDIENGILEATGNFISFKFAGHKQKQNFFKRIFG